MRARAEDQAGIQQNLELIPVAVNPVLRFLPAGYDTKISVLESAEYFSQPLFVGHLIAVNVAQMGLAAQEIFDLPGSGTGEKKKGIVFFFPVSQESHREASRCPLSGGP